MWLYGAICGAVVLVLGLLYVRFVVYAQVLGAAAAPIALSLVARRYASECLRDALNRVGALALFTIAPLTPALGWPSPEDAARSTCIVQGMVPALARLPGAIVLTGVSDTPELLWLTPVRTVGSLYHRSVDGFLRARDAWRTGISDTVPDALKATGVTHVLACELMGARSKLVSDLPPDTLEDRLSRRAVPPWLKEEARAGGYALYRIVEGE
jgi:hypothetical protein